MISLEYLREIEPGLRNMSDAELIKVRNMLYSLGQLTLDCWGEKKSGSKNPFGVGGLPNGDMQK